MIDFYTVKALANAAPGDRIARLRDAILTARLVMETGSDCDHEDATVLHATFSGWELQDLAERAKDERRLLHVAIHRPEVAPQIREVLAAAEADFRCDAHRALFRAIELEAGASAREGPGFFVRLVEHVRQQGGDDVDAVFSYLDGILERGEYPNAERAKALALLVAVAPPTGGELKRWRFRACIACDVVTVICETTDIHLVN